MWPFDYNIGSQACVRGYVKYIDLGLAYIFFLVFACPVSHFNRFVFCDVAMIFSCS